MQVDKFTWEVNTEPRGWKPGADLIVINPGYKQGPFVRLVLLELPWPTTDDEQPAIHAVEFHRDAREKVLIWLRMFANPENYATISKQIL